ncbi:MAG: aminoacyl-tRNA synthetase [Pseudomonadota bacterium]
MRMSDQEYFRSCIARERQLAHLLGHQHIEECYESAGTLWDNAQALPKWTRDWQACGPLLARYALPLSFEPEPLPKGSVRVGSTIVHVADHPTCDRAVMYAIVKELVHRLEHPRSAARPVPAFTDSRPDGAAANVPAH